MELFFRLDERAWQRLSMCRGKRWSDDSYHHLQRPLSVRSLPEFNRRPYSLSLMVEFRPMTWFILGLEDLVSDLADLVSDLSDTKAPVVKCKWSKGKEGFAETGGLHK